MTRGAALDIQGRPCSREEVAKGLGFVDVEALDRWDVLQGFPEDLRKSAIISHVCNLLSEVKQLRAEIEAVSDRLICTGTERIGYDEVG